MPISHNCHIRYPGSAMVRKVAFHLFRLLRLLRIADIVMVEVDMSKPTNRPTKPMMPSPEERVQAHELMARLKGDCSRRMVLCFYDPDGGLPVLEMPPWVARLLLKILAEMEEGHGMLVMSDNDGLSTQEAADLLGVSRPFLIKQVQLNQIPCRRVGTHRRILTKDLIAYRDRMEAKSDKILDKLVQEGPTWEP